MHESSLARQLLTKALELVPNGSRLRNLRGTLAETEHLHPEAIRFHFTAFAKGTLAEDATLELTLVHVEARCHGCGYVYAPDHHLTLCPRCNHTEATLLGSTGVSIESVDVD